jgi:hypothetical protein
MQEISPSSWPSLLSLTLWLCPQTAHAAPSTTSQPRSLFRAGWLSFRTRALHLPAIASSSTRPTTTAAGPRSLMLAGEGWKTASCDFEGGPPPGAESSLELTTHTHTHTSGIVHLRMCVRQDRMAVPGGFTLCHVHPGPPLSC